MQQIVGSDQVVGENEKKEEKKHEKNVQPRFGAPMHGVDFGKMTTQGAPRTHLNASDWLHGAGRLRQRRVASGLAAVL